MLPQLVHWKYNLEKLPDVQRVFEKWYFIRLSKILFSNKPGELIVFCEAPLFCGLSLEELISRAEKLAVSWGLCVKEMYNLDDKVAMLVYDRFECNRLLENVENMPFFLGLKYPMKLTVEEFLEEIKIRWNKRGLIPHEIGVCLGYPVKDVVGFLNVSNLDYWGTCGWRVYGDPVPSLKLKNEYDYAEGTAYEFLKQKTAPK